MDVSTHPIAALSTPPGRGALAVIRLTGDGSQSVFAAIIRGAGRFEKQIARKIGVYTVVDRGKNGENRVNLAVFDEKNQEEKNTPENPFFVDSSTITTGMDRISTDVPAEAATCVPLSIETDTVSAGAACISSNVEAATSSPLPAATGTVSAGAIRISPNAGSAVHRPLPVDTDDSSEVIDEVTAIKYDAPHSFTGEEMVEIFCHGGTAITGKILDRLFREGARPAGRGEFSRRAFVNGKIGLLKAESIAGLIESQTEMRLQSALLAYQGKQLESLEILKRKIINTLSDIESRIEFSEDDDVAESRMVRISANKKELGTIITELKEELRRGERVKAFDDGIMVTLAGPANAGKSSLFNEILGYDRSIVHDRPGTTRDIVSERIIFEGAAVKLFDSAGIRDTSDAVERQGIERTMAAVRGAHFVLWVTAADEPLNDTERRGIFEVINNMNNTGFEVINNNRINTNVGATAPGRPQSPTNNKILIIINKIDLANSPEKKKFCEEHSLKYIETSLTENINMDNLFGAISLAIHSITDNIPVPQLIINERHRSIIELIIQDISNCVDNFDREELSAHYLISALGRLEEFLGHVAGDEVLDEIFGKFCIGK